MWVSGLVFMGMGQAAFAEPPLAVTVSILPQKYFVEQIGGSQVSVQVMVRPGQNPSLFDPTQRQIADLAGSKLYFRIGVPFETVWANKIREANPKLNIVDTHVGLYEQEHEEHHGTHEHNPHTWLSPVLVKKMAERIKTALIEADPSHSKHYTENYQKFISDLDALDHEIRSTLKPVEKRHFMVYHPAWSYFAKAYGLTETAIEADGKEPGPQALAGVIEKGRRLGIRVIFIQKQFSQKVVRPIATALGARVVQVDPLAEDYVENLRQVARTFSEAMQ